MLAALRPYVAYDKVKRRMVWDGGYNAVVEAWEKLGGTMMQSCAETSQSLGGANNQNATGKHRPLSGGLTSTEIKASVKTSLPHIVTVVEQRAKQLEGIAAVGMKR